MKGKRREVKALLDELAKDSKRSFIQHQSNRTELLREILDSLSQWLNDIWMVVYEHNVNFSEAHACLLYIGGVLDHLADRCHGGCDVVSWFSGAMLKNCLSQMQLLVQQHLRSDHDPEPSGQGC